MIIIKVLVIVVIVSPTIIAALVYVAHKLEQKEQENNKHKL